MAYRLDLERKIARMFADGRIGPEWTIRQGSRHWEADVVFLPRPRSHRRKSGAWGTIWRGSALAGGFVAGYFLVQALVIAIAAAMPFVIAGVLILAGLAMIGRREVIEIVQKVTIRR
jgi:hypothetical protein